MLDRKKPIGHRDKNARCNSGKFVDQELLVFLASDVFQDRIGRRDVKRPVSERQGFVWTNLDIPYARIGLSEVAALAKTACGDLFGVRVFSLEKVRALRDDIGNADVD